MGSEVLFYWWDRFLWSIGAFLRGSIGFPPILVPLEPRLVA